jgi:prepilin-type N-terminal cleavage/methylation domain-containing protein
MKMKSLGGVKARTRGRGNSGFTLIELMVSIAVFLVIGGMAMSLFRVHASTFADQQNVVSLNMSMRNALTQMETDIVNAGTGYFSTADVASWPIGVTIVNQTGGSSCHTAGTLTYSSGCFDTLNIIVPNPAAVPGQPTACTLTTSGAMTLSPASGSTAAQLAAALPNGAQVVFMHSTTSGTLMSSALLTAASVVSGSNVNITYNPTNSDGSNTAAHDPLGLTTNGDAGVKALTLTDQFCNGTDWVVTLAPITYTVNASNSSDPQLTRTEAGNTYVIADQIIGFKVGSALFNDTTDTSGTYNYNTANYADGSTACPACYDLVRAIRISLIGRTSPTRYSGSTFTNSFDGGPYKIQALSIIVNPRNLSMND